MSYEIFVRNWWKENARWPNGLEPDSNGEREYLGTVKTEREAQAICRDYTARNPPGRLSRKAEYQSV